MPHNYTRAEILAHQHAELAKRAGEISTAELDDTARAALLEAIERDLVIGLYTVGVEQEWRIELNHFGRQPVCPPGRDPRKDTAWWQQYHALITSWPYPQSDGSEDVE